MPTKPRPAAPSLGAAPDDPTQASGTHPVLLASLGLLAGWAYFHRAPSRRIPPALSAVVSPADGTVIHIEQTDTPQLAFFKNDVLNELTLVGMAPPFQVVVIELNLLNVHLQRAPIAGVVLAQHYFPGRFRNALYSADRPHLVNSNEKLLTVIGTPQTAVAVVQVAGLVARRIRTYVAPGQLLTKGQNIGMITFGSQVVLVVPAAARLNVQVGSRVTDGASVVAWLPDTV